MTRSIDACIETRNKAIDHVNGYGLFFSDPLSPFFPGLKNDKKYKPKCVGEEGKSSFKGL